MKEPDITGKLCVLKKCSPGQTLHEDGVCRMTSNRPYPQLKTIDRCGGEYIGSSSLLHYFTTLKWGDDDTCFTPGFKLEIPLREPNAEYRHLYVDELLKNNAFMRRAQTFIGYKTKVNVINGSLKGILWRSAPVTEDCRSEEIVAYVLLVRKCFPLQA